MRSVLTTLLLVRHGETDWNRDHRWQGYTGPPLNDRGRQQARELAARVDGNIDAVYTSDSDRARETAEIVAESLELSVHADERLREVNFGEWEGLTRHEIDRLYAGAFSRWEACETPLPAGVESDEDMAGRVLESLREIAAGHAGGRVLVVTSGGPIRATQAHAGGVDQAVARRSLRTIENCGVVELVVREGAFELSSAEPCR